MFKVGDLSVDKSLESRSAGHFAQSRQSFHFQIRGSNLLPQKSSLPYLQYTGTRFFVVYVFCCVQPGKHSIRLSKQKYEDSASIIIKSTTIRIQKQMSCLQEIPIGAIV